MPSLDMGKLVQALHYFKIYAKLDICKSHARIIGTVFANCKEYTRGVGDNWDRLDLNIDATKNGTILKPNRLPHTSNYLFLPITLELIPAS